jgi:long-chain acyl-CoA synthetase
VFPREVEDVVATHPAVAQVGVIGVPDATWGEALHAVIVPAAGASPTEEEIVELTRRELASYMKPKSVEFVDALPKGPTGKILKRELREPYWEGHERNV